MTLTENEVNFIENTVYSEVRRAGGPVELFKEVEECISGNVRNTNETNRDLTPFQDMFIDPQQIFTLLRNSPGIVLPTGIDNPTLGEVRKHFIACIFNEAEKQGKIDQCDKESLLTGVEQMRDNAWQFNRESGKLIIPETLFNRLLLNQQDPNVQRQLRHMQTRRSQGGEGSQARQTRHRRQGM